MFQSTPPRGGRRATASTLSSAGIVSIHAPAWGATCANHRLVGQYVGFQSTPPRGGRHPLRTVRTVLIWSFNPRPRVGGDMHALCDNISLSQFQSTPPRGGRRTRLCPTQSITKFQSTPPRGGRRIVESQNGNMEYVSIHAPAWGATLRNTGSHYTSDRFNPRPRVGGDTV